jgi:hypothetical protein
MFDHAIESKERTIKNNLRQQQLRDAEASATPAPAKARTPEKAPTP